MCVLKVENLRLGYGGKTVAEHIDFKLNAGDYLCIIGENGSGKSTLIKALAGLVKPLGGEIVFSGGSRGRVGYLPQQTEVQRDFPASVKEIVMSGNAGRYKFRPFYSAEDKKRARDNMEKMQIMPLADRCFRELSGGQQQRALLARALCAADEVLLLDEPVTGLDEASAALMYSLTEKLNRNGLTVITVTHDISAALCYATHILYMGKTVFFGTRDEFAERKGDLK